MNVLGNMPVCDFVQGRVVTVSLAQIVETEQTPTLALPSMNFVI